MKDPTVISILMLSQAAMWVLLIRHLLQCRDVRLDIYKIKVHLRMIKP